jgi:hypothetical protein
MNGATEESWFVSRKGKVVFSFSDPANWHMGPTHPPVQYFGGAVYPWVNGHDLKRKSPYVAEVKNEWSYTFTSTYGFMTYTNAY